MKDLQSLVEENIVIWSPALDKGQGEFYDAFLMGDGGVEEKYGCVELWGGRWKLRIGGKEDTGLRFVALYLAQASPQVQFFRC